MSVVVTPRSRSTPGLPLFRVPQSKTYSLTDAGVCEAPRWGVFTPDIVNKMARNNFILAIVSPCCEIHPADSGAYLSMRRLRRCSQTPGHAGRFEVS